MQPDNVLYQYKDYDVDNQCNFQVTNTVWYTGIEHISSIFKYVVHILMEKRGDGEGERSRKGTPLRSIKQISIT